MKRFRIKFYYLALGMEGNAETRDYGIILASTATEAMDKFLVEHPELADDWTRTCLSATEVRLTAAEALTFCRAASLGLSLGLNHRYEWYVNAQRALSHGSYKEIPKQERKLSEAFLAFEKTLISCSEEEAEAEALDLDGFILKLNNWYSGSRL